MIKSRKLIILSLLLSFATVILLGQSKPWADVPFIQDYSIRYTGAREAIIYRNVVSDRDGYIQVLTGNGLQRPSAGELLFPGKLVPDYQYRPVTDKKVTAICRYKDEIVYADDKAVFSNAWAGKLYIRHGLGAASIIAGGKDFDFLVSDGGKLAYLKDTSVVWTGDLGRDKVLETGFDQSRSVFIIRGKKGLYSFNMSKQRITRLVDKSGITCFAVVGDQVYCGTGNGYFVADAASGREVVPANISLPCNSLNVIRVIRDEVWFGSPEGAFRLNRDGRFTYYASLRWLPSDNVTDIAEGPSGSILVLTDRGLSKICFTPMTLHEKALFFEKQVRERHIRHGFNATTSLVVPGDITSGRLEDSDNDGLWTSMYLAGQAFRYAVEPSPEVLENIRGSMEAMERLYTVNSLGGFPSRSFERRGYKYDDAPWRRAPDKEWDWKSTTSSDEAIGHVFAFGVVAELVSDEALKKKAVMLLDTLMSHVLKNNFYLVDWDGKPTKWGRWNPEYVNARPVMVGDRKLNSSNIIGMLQTAWHFTRKEKYREAAFMLMKEHGYLENLMRPIASIGRAPADADELSRELSDGWNHSDDEMYYCGYWGLYRYALNDTLKEKYREAIIDHWNAERPEKEGLWIILTALTGKNDIGIDDAAWYLQQYPLDLVNWTVTNSRRKDIKFLEPGFRGQYTAEVLPPDELRISRHNANRFEPDGRGEGRSEYSAGDIWLLPYWAGRYLGVISSPVK
ncbi:MAG: hypothetical protein U0X39_14495 [Bacteroidales bacterium]